MNAQLNFINHKDLGFKKEALLSLQVNGSTEVVDGYEAFRNEALQNPLIRNMAVSNKLIIGGLGNWGARTIDGKGNPIQTGTYRLFIDADYFDVYGMKLVAGRGFYKNYLSDTLSYIVNEALVQKFGWKDAEAAINKPFEMGGRNGRVIGVVGNFHFNTLQHPIEPLVLTVRRPAFRQITVKADLTDPGKTIAAIAALWKKHFPAAMLEYGFVEEQLEAQYQAEKKFARFFLYFSVLALIIACLGLLGLASYTIHQRVKEIGIRKVLGATAADITTMLSRDFLKLVFIAAVIACPVAWLLMNKWLEVFAYRVRISGWVFLLAGAAALLIALCAVSFHSIKAAVSNPVKSLRTE